MATYNIGGMAKREEKANEGVYADVLDAQTLADARADEGWTEKLQTLYGLSIAQAQSDIRFQLANANFRAAVGARRKEAGPSSEKRAGASFTQVGDQARHLWSHHYRLEQEALTGEALDESRSLASWGLRRTCCAGSSNSYIFNLSHNRNTVAKHLKFGTSCDTYLAADIPYCLFDYLDAVERGFIERDGSKEEVDRALAGWAQIFRDKGREDDAMMYKQVLQEGLEREEQ